MTNLVRRPLLLLVLLSACVLLGHVATAEALVSAGGGFYFQSPQQFGWSYGALAFADADNVWATGGTQNNGSRLLHSSDGGTTWQAVDADPDPDRADWFDLEAARQAIVPAQRRFIDDLEVVVRA